MDDYVYFFVKKLDCWMGNYYVRFKGNQLIYLLFIFRLLVCEVLIEEFYFFFINLKLIIEILDILYMIVEDCYVVDLLLMYKMMINNEGVLFFLD